MRLGQLWPMFRNAAMVIYAMALIICAGCVIWLLNHLNFAIASFGLEEDQIDDLRRLQQVYAIGYDELDEHGEMCFRQREQVGACRINGISERRIRIITGGYHREEVRHEADASG